MKRSKKLKNVSIMIIIFLFMTSSSFVRSMRKEDVVFGYLTNNRLKKIGECFYREGFFEMFKIKRGEIKEIKIPENLRDIKINEFSSLDNGKQIIFATLDGKIHIYDLIKEKTIVEGKPYEILPNLSLIFSPDGKHYTYFFKNELILKKIGIIGEEKRFNFEGKNRVIKFSPDGKYIGAKSKKVIKIWNIKRKNNLVEMKNEKEFWDFSLSNNAEYILTSDFIAEEYIVKIWKRDKNEVTCIKQFKFKDAFFRYPTLSYDGKYFAIDEVFEGRLRIFEVATRKEIGQIKRENQVNPFMNLSAKSPIKKEDVDIKERIEWMRKKAPGVEKQKIRLWDDKKIEAPKVLV